MRKTVIIDAVLGIGCVTGCDDFLLVEGNSKTKEKPANWSVGLLLFPEEEERMRNSRRSRRTNKKFYVINPRLCI